MYASLLLVVTLLTFIGLDLAGQDYYKLLGVSRSASDKEIKKAFKKLAIKLHPDKNPGNSDVEKQFQSINAAYSVLSDPEKRRVYDQFGEEGLKDGNRGGGGGWNDIFGNFFGGGGRRQGGRQEMKKGPNIVVELQCTLEDLYNGRDFEVLQRRQVLCPHCRGTGADDPNDVTNCPVCGGSGVKIVNQQLAPGFVQRVQTTCDHCHGKGKIMNSVCTHCHGTKVQKGEQLLMIFIEKGMPNGHEIVSPSDSDENPEEEPGDVVFKIKTLPHKTFVRQGNDLKMTMKISLLQALVGFEVSFNHLDGHEVSLSRKDVTPPGFLQTVKGEGMPIHEMPSNKGNLQITYEIIFPRTVTEEQKTEFKRVLTK